MTTKSFIPGEWYKSNKGNSCLWYYLKVLSVTPERIWGQAILGDKQFMERHHWDNKETIKQALELGPVHLNEIQEWLPEHHEDKHNSHTFLKPVLEHRLLL